MRKYLAIGAILLILTGFAAAQSTSNKTVEDQEHREKPKLAEGIINYRFDITASGIQKATTDKNLQKSVKKAKKLAEKKLENLENTTSEKRMEKLEEKTEKGIKKVEKKAEKAEERAREGFEKSRISLKGFMTFQSGGYTLETGSETGENVVKFTVKIDSPPKDSDVTQQLDQKTLAEETRVEPGNYTAELSVEMDGKTIHTRTEKISVKSEQGETSGGDDKEKEERKNPTEVLERKTKSELIQMIKELRKEVQELKTQLRKQETPSEPVQQEDPEETKTDENQTGRSGNKTANNKGEENSKGEREKQPGRPDKAPAKENSKKPGFVDNLLKSIFG